MKPLRRVVSVAHMLGFTLDCGHTIYRRPLSGKHIIPVRVQCMECQAARIRANERREAYEAGMQAVFNRHPNLRNSLDFRQTKPVA